MKTMDVGVIVQHLPILDSSYRLKGIGIVSRFAI